MKIPKNEFFLDANKLKILSQDKGLYIYPIQKLIDLVRI